MRTKSKLCQHSLSGSGSFIQYARKISRKTNISYPLIRTRRCAYQGARNVSLSESFAYVLNGWPPLKDYKNAIQPHAGFNRSVIDELIKLPSPLKRCQRCLVLSFDQIKIQENLVFDKYTRDLIRYVDLGDIELNDSACQGVNDLATHALVYYIQGVASDLKFSLFYHQSCDCISNHAHILGNSSYIRVNM